MATKQKPKQIWASDLGIDLASGDEREIFRWFLACLLFGKPIQQSVSQATYHEFIKAGLDTPQAILKTSWGDLVKVLGRGHYVRYDESTATKLHKVMKHLITEWDGSLVKLHNESKDTRELVQNLLSFYGVGPTTVVIFLREMKNHWPKAKVKKKHKDEFSLPPEKKP